MINRNEDIKKKIKEAGFCYWQVAEKLGMADSNFSRLLRYPIPQKKRQQIIDAIDELIKERDFDVSDE